MEQPEYSTPAIALGQKFSSFESLKDAIDRYQKENDVQLIVKDSKLLGCIAKTMPKLMEVVNKDIIYYRLTYACEFHGEFKPRGKMRPKHVSKRRGCPMRILIRLAEDLNHLVVYELFQQHNHPLVKKAVTKTPKQQTYRISLTNSSQYLLQKLGEDGQILGAEIAGGSHNFDEDSTDLNTLKASTPIGRIIGNGVKRIITAADESELSFEELKKQKLTLQNKKLELETRKLELENRKLELELKALEAKQEDSEVQAFGNTFYVSHVIDDSKEGLNESTVNNTFSTSTAEVIRTLAGRGQPLRIITQ